MKEFVEKLIDRLEEEKSDWNYDYNVPINKAIQIVKELAEEHNNDFCEWQEDGVFYNVECKGREYICTDLSAFEFCPYCRKKIKVVDAPYKKGE